MNHEDRSLIINALGGKKGLLDSGIPALVFLIVFNVQNVVIDAAIFALAVSAVITVVRLVRREKLQNAIAGIVGVLICFLLVRSTGNAEDFYLPGLFINAGYGALYLVTNLAGWPIIGVVLGPLLGEDFHWRKVPERKRVYMLAGWLWVGLFVSRLLVQYPLYLSGNVNALGIARLIMGPPLFIACAWATWLVIKRVPVAKKPSKSPVEALGDEAGLK
jgi:intracellular septation protein A